MCDLVDDMQQKVTLRQQGFFWCFAVIALFMFLGRNALWGSEDRWAEIAREMMLTGDILHPAINWQVYFDKPHLTYWLILPFGYLAGGVNEFIVRLPSALAALAGLYGTMVLGRKLFSAQVALAGCWMLLTGYGFLFWARAAAADVANLSAIVLAVAFFYQVEERAKFKEYFCFYLICFAGAWAKGLPALVMPFVVIAPHLLMEKRWRKHLKISNFLAFFLCAGLYLVPFYLAATLPLAPGLTLPGHDLSGLELVWRENIVRVFMPFDHKDPIYSYLYNLPRILAPWTLLIGVGIAGMIRHWKNLPMRTRELMIGTLLMFLLFTASGSRRWYYILPLMPFCALLGADGLVTPAGVARWNRPAVMLMRYLITIIASLGVAAVLSFPLWNRLLGFELPWLLILAPPVAGILTLVVMLCDNQPGSPLEHLSGLPKRLAAVLIGGSILTATVFGAILPSLTAFRTEKPFHLAMKKDVVGIPPERFFFWRDDADAKTLFYLNLPGAMRSTNVVEDEALMTGMLRDFLRENAGHQVVVFSFLRPKELEPLARAVKTIGVSLDVTKPTYSEQPVETISKKSSKRRGAWIFTVPALEELK